jgi:hypothetical protein
MGRHLCKHFYVMKKELEWKWIEGFEGSYKIYRNGDVFRVEGMTTRVNHGVLKPYPLNAMKMKKIIYNTGYYKICLTKTATKKARQFLLHRLIALHFIENPNNHKEVDHINRIRTDNRIENLRWASRSTNALNRVQTKRKDNKSGYVGVTFERKICKYRAFIYDRKKLKNIRLGNFDTAIEASIAYNEASKKMFGDLAYQN